MAPNMSAPAGILHKPGESDAKRQRLPNGDYLSFASISMPPPSHDKHDRTSMRYKVSPTELVTASKSILNQVNWSEVALDVVGRERPALYRDAFEKILRLHVEELLTQKDREEKKLKNYQEEGQRPLSAIKITEQVLSRSAFTSCGTDEKPSSLKEQGDDDSFVDNASDISGHDDFTDEGEESETDEDDTENESNGKDEDGDYEEDRSSI